MKACKRAFDFVFSLIGLVALSPLLVVVAAAVRLHDGGPVFFLQERVGRGFRPFKIIKFRTMEPGAEARGRAITARGDARITGVGRVLRKTKIDELPQLVNVLKGEMSLVGPRPEVPKYIEMFRRDFEEILKVRPGITDYASVRYKDEEEALGAATDPERYYVSDVLPAKIGLNLSYIRNRGMLEDVKVILVTLSALYTRPLMKLFDFLMKKLDSLTAGSRAVPAIERMVDGRRGRVMLSVHAALAAASAFLAFSIVFDGEVPLRFKEAVPWFALGVLAVRLPLFSAFGLYRSLWRYTGMVDLARIIGSVTCGTAVLFAGGELTRHTFLFPRTVIVVEWILAIGLMSAPRLALRAYRDFTLSGGKGAGKRVLILGAGNAGEMIVRDMRKNPHLHEPVGFVDDDPAKQGLYIHGVPILGTTHEILRVVRTCRPEEILIAIPSGGPATLQRIMKTASECKLPIQTLPNLTDVLEGHVSINQIRPLELEDLLPRPPVKADADKLRAFTFGKTVMVTGAGGSIGSEICRQAIDLGAKSVIAFERHENSLYNLEMELRHRCRGVRFFPVVGDVNDPYRLEEVLKLYSPDTLYHAAAHKHVPMMEINPREAIYNNVLGTRKTAMLAGTCGVETFVLISTDKAVNPTSIMGASKRFCELIVRALNEGSKTKYITVRFGNVLGSSGSVVPLFREQIKRGGPVTVTHPDIERYLMLIPEAVQLVMQAASMGKGGEIFVLDMGDPIKIADLAKSLIVLSGYEPEKDVKIEYVGLRPGEKLYEELFDESEEVSVTPDSKVYRAVAKDLPSKATVLGYAGQLEKCVLRKDTHGMITLLCQLVSNYSHPLANREHIRKAA